MVQIHVCLFFMKGLYHPCFLFISWYSCGTYQEDLFNQFTPTVFEKSVKNCAPSFTYRTPVPRMWYPPLPPQPGHCCSDGGRNDPAGLQHCFFLGGGGGGGEGEGEYLGFILKLDMASSIFPNIFFQDCRLSYGTNCFDYHFHYENLP